MKRLLTLIAIFFIGLAAQASEHYLNTIVLEGTDDGYNIVLNSDSIPQVKKSAKGSDSIKLDVKGLTAANNLNAIYRGTSDINSLIIETVSSNELKIYIQAKNIAGATIMAKTSNEGPVIISERFPIEKVLWTVCVISILIALFKSAKALTEYENSIVIKKDIKDREIELYRNFQKELESMPKINSKIKNAYATNVMPRSRRNYKELARR